jgi:hypothetical protein
VTIPSKSDAQLDAEAAGRSPERLDFLVEFHRNLRRDDLSIERMVARQPPTSRDPNTGIVTQHDATATGMNMSARLYRFVESAPISEFPWHGAFRMLRVECRRRHTFHRGSDVPYWRGSLCQEFVRLVVIGPEKRLSTGPLSIRQAAMILRYDNPEPVVRYAFAYIEAAMDQARARAERRAREDEGQALICKCGHAYSRHGGVVEGWRCGYDNCGCQQYLADIPKMAHHIPSDDHRAECPQCRRNAA